MSQTQSVLVHHHIRQKKRQQILTLEKLERDNIWHFCLKNENEAIMKIVAVTVILPVDSALVVEQCFSVFNNSD